MRPRTRQRLDDARRPEVPWFRRSSSESALAERKASRAFERFGLFDQLDEFGSVRAVGLFIRFPDAFLSQLLDSGQRGIALVGAVAEDHAEAGHGGGEFEIGRGLAIFRAGVLDRRFHQRALIAVGLLVAKLEREQLAGLGSVGERGGFLILERIDVRSGNCLLRLRSFLLTAPCALLPAPCHGYDLV